MDGIQRNTNFKEQAGNNTRSEMDEKGQESQEEILAEKQRNIVLRSAQETMPNTIGLLKIRSG